MLFCLWDFLPCLVVLDACLCGDFWTYISCIMLLVSVHCSHHCENDPNALSVMNLQLKGYFLKWCTETQLLVFPLWSVDYAVAQLKDSKNKNVASMYPEYMTIFLIVLFIHLTEKCWLQLLSGDSLWICIRFFSWKLFQWFKDYLVGVGKEGDVYLWTHF